MSYTIAAHKAVLPAFISSLHLGLALLLQANEDPTFNMSWDKFSGLEGDKNRDEKEKCIGVQPPQQNKFAQVGLSFGRIVSYFFQTHHRNLIFFSTYCQTKDALKKFMESLIAKAGKLRSLIRDLESKYDDPAATSSTTQIFWHNQPSVPWEASSVLPPPEKPKSCRLARCVQSLKTQVTKIDGAYDDCNHAWTKGEAEGFFSEELLDYFKKHMFPNLYYFRVLKWNWELQPFRFHTCAEAKMKAATYVCRPYKNLWKEHWSSLLGDPVKARIFVGFCDLPPGALQQLVLSSRSGPMIKLEHIFW